MFYLNTQSYERIRCLKSGNENFGEKSWSLASVKGMINQIRLVTTQTPKRSRHTSRTDENVN